MRAWLVSDPWRPVSAVLAAALAVAMLAPDAWIAAARDSVVGAANAQPVPIPAPAPPEPTPPKKPEDRAAERAKKVLAKTQETLSKVPRDPGGHRDKALAAIRVAITETSSLAGGEGGGE